jgi:SAM-dependent methyltransferase
MNIREYNRRAWDREVERGSEWTRPVGPEVIEAARRGRWSVLLTETRPVPREWFPELRGADVLCLAASGGQQAPVFAAAGARVTVLDNSPAQLAQDAAVAERDGLELRTVLGDMADLSAFADESFDLVFHPVSNLFVPDVLPVWREAFRVVRPGGLLLAGFNNPALYLFGPYEATELTVKYELPYSDLESLPEEERRPYVENEQPLEFSHTLTDLLGGQLDAGFLLTALYEDRHREHPLGRYMGTYLATRAVKPPRS